MTSEQRQQLDRRRRPRAGRRATDVGGFTPLVFVIDSDSRRREVSETILARLRFAVAPFATVDAAVAVMAGLRPDVIAAGSTEYDHLRDRIAAGSTGLLVPLVPIPESAAPDAIVDAVRNALRTPTVTW